jgi:hypothetical protein
MSKNNAIGTGQPTAELREEILWNNQRLAYIFRKEINPEKTTFLTPGELNLQLGLVVYPAGGSVIPHVHLPVKREIVGTCEVLVVKKGRCEIDFYNDERQLVLTRELREGDVVLTVAGGHGFRMLEDTILMEVKQGPYLESGDKVRF